MKVLAVLMALMVAVVVTEDADLIELAKNAYNVCSTRDPTSFENFDYDYACSLEIKRTHPDTGNGNDVLTVTLNEHQYLMTECWLKDECAP